VHLQLAFVSIIQMENQHEKIVQRICFTSLHCALPIHICFYTTNGRPYEKKLIHFVHLQIAFVFMIQTDDQHEKKLFKEIASSPHMVHLQIAFVPMKQMKD
jgi:hypothetical protein